MTEPAYLHQENFRRILSRNISLPLGVGALSAAVFVSLIVYLLSALSWVEQTGRVISGANQITELSADMEASMYGYLVTGEESFLRPYEIAKPRIAAETASLTALIADNTSQSNRLQRITALQTQWNEFAQNIIDLRRKNLDYLALARATRGKSLTDEIRRESLEFIRIEERLLLQRNDTSRSTTFWGMAGYLLFSLGLSGLLAFVGRRELLRLSDTYAKAMQLQTDNAELLAQLSWLRTGQRQLAEQTVGHQAMEPLGRSVLEFAAQYLDVAVAALYVREGNGRLQRVAAYGFSEDRAPLAQSFYEAEGLVGQAALENRVLRLDNLPDNYLQVTSGLGQGSPRHVLVVPVHNDGQVNGVVELGFLRALAPRDLEFVTMIATNIGNSIHAALYRQQLQDVLEESQQLNEKLQIQQEELRTTNEELEEKSRALKEYQVNLENQQAELEQTNERLSELALSLDQKNGALNQAQTLLEERATELSRASRYKSEFLANMSHELRTPLNSSLILAKLLSDNPKGNLSDEQVKFAHSIYSAGNDLLDLINDILDISKVEAGKLELSPEDMVVSKLLESLKNTFEPLAAQKKLAFDITVEQGTPATLFTDRQRVEQILKNLLSNAIKFTVTGKVSLAVSLRPEGHVAFVVRDSGIGIRADQQQLIFDAFRQADGTTSRRYGGTGLGLSISRDLTALLGGAITVESSEGQGSTFTLLLPCSPGQVQVQLPAHSGPRPAGIQPALASPPAVVAAPVPTFADDRHEPPNGPMVLVIEDDATFARILYDLAHELRYQCLVAHGADHGVDLATRFLPQAILLDLGLPDQPGLSVLRRLKDNPRTRHIPVHVVSANDRSEIALQMGAIGYALKPTTREELKQVFKKLEDKFTQKVKRVLLVEDDALQRASLIELIGGGDVEIAAVETGTEALALLASTIFDCMIVDLRLPDIEGYELLQRMSTDDICSFPPVIVYTGRNLTRQEEADLLKYSRSIIIKGARSPERLLDEVTLFLHKVESDLSAGRQIMLQAARSRDRVFEGRKILLVDDDVRNIFALTSALEQKGLLVEIGRNGFEALSKLDEVDDVDLVLMDIMMPGMDGLEATRRIRKDPRFQRLPIIAVTAKAMKDDQEQCLKAGTNDYLAKPIDLDRLFSLLRVWMPNVERA
ncbi:MAG: two-component system sensor histidine kinase/response regulator [Polaromonas sp. 39-63-203]|jgi:CheY-like chemotaxis protein/CHASE3 domain sensor protein|uniref:response regulator n=1 Tax=Polaromonas sp. TaxID=1869339 RepID=UPI000BC82789|nr:response regulator [Polaromonas sp.]OYY51561.1 MAG: two-component system sensor histidine kinase/response regulator [Polaromonas sp. 35-63-240]OYZ83648.1 MAG: two-component system sensor histidine kinase/response regulator [Polaromonas sp. 24-62-144]OZA97600.1 MAG: two-component system sensor histidine kinase/response regulator [Polaromonas sp. 39-63-203]HQS32286.1 response regulator [Polaromonas sp.]HQS91404.1 response regulator [Polaromonas sp.]